MPNVTLPPVVFNPESRDDQTGAHYIGPFPVGTNLYAVLGTSTFTFLGIFKSTDNGQTWNRLDQSHAPRLDTNSEFDAIILGALIYVVLPTKSQDGININLEVITFDTGSDTYGAYLGPGTQNATEPRIAAFGNGDLLVAYYDTSQPVLGAPISLIIFAGGLWSAPVTLANSAFQNNGGLIVGPDDIARIFYFTQAFQQNEPVSVFFRTFTHGGVLGAQQAIFTSTFRASREFPLPSPIPTGRPVIWNNKIILPYYGNPTGSGKQAGVYIGDPYTAPVWTFTLVDTIAWAGTALDSYAYSFVDSGNNLTLFWCSVDTTLTVSQMYFAVNSGAGFGAPQLFYDEIANPPTSIGIPFGTVLRTLSATKFANGKFGVVTSATNGCAGFYLIDGSIAPPVPPLPPSPPTYWNPGSSESLLCEKQYPWSVPPKDRIPVSVRNSIPSPAANVLTELWSYTVPDGFWFVYDTLLFQADVAGYVQGSGSLIFTLDVNTPTVGPALPVGRPIAKFTTNVGELAEPVKVAPVQLYQGDILRAKVNITDNTLGVGLPNVIHAAVEGWLFPHSRL